MWNEINDEIDIKEFMDRFSCFHDSCIKEIKYVSGAYINNQRAMHPINDVRTLSVIVQRQYADISMLEMEFQDLKFLKLTPHDSNYTCEILDSIMCIKDGYIYWSDCWLTDSLDLYAKSDNGMLVCAKKLRWRAIDGCLGSDDFFIYRQNN